jgi:hypothetical protein
VLRDLGVVDEVARGGNAGQRVIGEGEHVAVVNEVAPDRDAGERGMEEHLGADKVELLTDAGEHLDVDMAKVALLADAGEHLDVDMAKAALLAYAGERGMEENLAVHKAALLTDAGEHLDVDKSKAALHGDVVDEFALLGDAEERVSNKHLIDDVPRVQNIGIMPAPDGSYLIVELRQSRGPNKTNACSASRRWMSSRKTTGSRSS